MLVEDHSLVGDQLCYRPSQSKFESDDLDLEISKTFVTSRPAFLNQPLVRSLFLRCSSFTPTLSINIEKPMSFSLDQDPRRSRRSLSDLRRLAEVCLSL
jgi:hypothetical protein